RGGRADAREPSHGVGEGVGEVLAIDARVVRVQGRGDAAQVVAHLGEALEAAGADARLAPLGAEPRLGDAAPGRAVRPGARAELPDDRVPRRDHDGARVDGQARERVGDAGARQGRGLDVERVGVDDHLRPEVRARAGHERARAELGEAVPAPAGGAGGVRRRRTAVPAHDEGRLLRAADQPVDERALALVAEAEPDDDAYSWLLPHAPQNLASGRSEAPHDLHGFVDGAAVETSGPSARDFATSDIAAIAPW